MKKTLRGFYIALKSKYNEYENFKDDCFSFTHEENQQYAKDIYENELVDKYCEFIDVYSYYCDVIIEKSNDEQLITQSMLFYYMMNKEYFASKSEEEDIVNIIHIINQLEPHNEILDYEFFYETENCKVLCELCNNEGDIPDCVLCGRPADFNENESLKGRIKKVEENKSSCEKDNSNEKCNDKSELKNTSKNYDTETGEPLKKKVKYKFNFNFNGPFCEDKDFVEDNEIYCNKCEKFFDSDKFKDHCRFIHGGYIMVDTKENKRRNLQSNIIDQCESMGYDEGEINYVLDHYKLDYFSIKYISKLAKVFDNVLNSSSDSDDFIYEDDSYDVNSDNISIKCNVSSSNDVSEDENKINK